METVENKQLQVKESAEQIREKIRFNMYLTVKRILDVFLSILGLIIFSPLFIIISIIVKIDSKGPIFFAHERIGKDGKTIKIYKFRTMCENADEMKNAFTEKQKQEFEKSFKLNDDPRITKVGKFLRKSSLDELPQLVNILKGEMSLIGPRPIVEEELKKYGNQSSKFLRATPGLTGLWQTKGRSKTTYEKRMEMELYYVDNRSLQLDAKIFFRTFKSLFEKGVAK